MARQISELQSLPFYEILGAPLLALIQAETQAAQAMAEFIERVGFVKSTETGENSNGGKDSPDHIGDLRMIMFRYKKPGTEGKIKEFTIEVPLLSLVPIPALQIKDAQIDFSVQVHDVYEEEVKTTVQDRGSEEGEFVEAKRIGLRTGMSNRESGRQMHVKVNVQQAEIPIGLTQLFRIMNQSINSTGVVAENE